MNACEGKLVDKCANVFAVEHKEREFDNQRSQACDRAINTIVDNEEVLCMPQQEAQFWEVSGNDMDVPISVKGRLRASLVFWKEVLYASPAVLDVI